MKRTLLLSAMVLMVVISAIASVNEKLSGTTQLLIAERDGKISLDMQVQGPKKLTRAPLLRTKPVERIIAKPELIGGVEMVSAFIHINPSYTSKLEAMGVIVQERFKDFVTAMIPVNKIEQIASLSDVKQVNVARLMKTRTNMARYYTNTDDVLDYSNDAITAGLPQAFKGSGVVVGVIDDGIDFQHTMFKDANGNTRIKRAYVARNTSFTTYTNITSSSPTTDDSGESHGTHTSTTAGGSNITVSGTTYGGMAPESSLVLVGCGQYLYNTNIANGIKYIFDYADSQNMPAVCSISLGSHMGPHDGTGELASVYSQYAGSNPNHVIVYAAGNEAGGSYGSQYSGGNASSSTPFTTVLNGTYYAQYYGSSSYNNRMYNGYDVFYARTAGRSLACRLHVVDTSAKSVLWTSSAITSSTSSVSGISTYFSASPTVTISRDSYSNKYYVQLYFNQMSKRSSYNDSKYALAVSVYPTNGSTMIDSWDVTGYNAFGSMTGTYGGYTFVAGSDDCSIGDECGSDDVISVGAYCSKRTVKDYQNQSHTLSYYTMNDIAYFSSYQAPGCGPTGVAKPDICAPGATIVAGINHYDSETMGNGYADYGMYLVYNSSNSSLGSMDGTSMATPCAAGIIALYLQAAKYAGKTLNTEGIRDVFANSAITDNYTSKKNFGPYGKINALAGIKYILGDALPTPELTVTPTSLSFNTEVGSTVTKTFTVTGTDLTSNVNVSVTGTGFSVSPTTITPAAAMAGATVTVTYAPTSAGTRTGTVTVSSTGAQDATVALTGTASSTPTLTVTPTDLTFNTTVGTPVTKTFTLTGANLTDNLTLEVTSGSQNFNIDKTSILKSALSNGVSVTVTYDPEDAGTHTGVVTISGGGVSSKTVTLSGTAEEPERTINVSPASLSFEAAVGNTVTKTFALSGSNLNGALTLTLNDASGYYTISPTTVSAARAANGLNVTVTYKPMAGGNHNASITISGGGAESKTVTLNGTATAPTITATPSTLTMSAVAGQMMTQTFTVTGTNLSGNLSLALADANGVFSIDRTSITAASAAAGVTVTVTYHPTTSGTHNATVTISGGGAESKTVTLNGSAAEPARTITTSTDVLNLSSLVGETVTGTFTVTGENLNGPLSLALNGGDGVYSITPTTVSAASAAAGVTVTVTYAPTVFGNQTASITISGGGASPVTVNLNGTANIAKYAPVMLAANDSYVAMTRFRANWTDETPDYNVTSYTLEVSQQQPTPQVQQLEVADFSSLTAQTNSSSQLTNQVDNAAQFLPQGWSAGVLMWVNNGCVMSGVLNGNAGTLTTKSYDLTGYDKMTVVFSASVFNNTSYGTSATVRVSTSAGYQDVTINSTSYGTYTVVLDCAENDQVTFTALSGIYCVEGITIYAGDLNAAQLSLMATETGDTSYRLITGITPDKFYDVLNLEAAGTYSYHVKALYADGSESDWSNLEWVTLHEHEGRLGDVNHDGIVEIADVTKLIDGILGMAEICPICGDLNQNGTIEIADVTMIIDLILGQNNAVNMKGYNTMKSAALNIMLAH